MAHIAQFLRFHRLADLRREKHQLKIMPPLLCRQLDKTLHRDKIDKMTEAGDGIMPWRCRPWGWSGTGGNPFRALFRGPANPRKSSTRSRIARHHPLHRSDATVSRRNLPWAKVSDYSVAFFFAENAARNYLLLRCCEFQHFPDAKEPFALLQFGFPQPMPIRVPPRPVGDTIANVRIAGTRLQPLTVMERRGSNGAPPVQPQRRLRAAIWRRSGDL